MIRKVHLSSLLDLLVQLEKDGVEYIDVSGKRGKKGRDRMLVDVWDDYFYPGVDELLHPKDPLTDDNLDNLIG